ncbi:MAG: phosphatidylglycerol lysyltransferase domain-containing protein [Bryobacteraceae bacterium]|nr:phosphatidylglycerol lysyltransferase domain-containing protein [Bryobacteraceae bacterium]
MAKLGEGNYELPRWPEPAAAAQTDWRRPLVWWVAGLTCGSGLLNIYSVMSAGDPARVEALRRWLPLEILDSSRSGVLLLGFALVLLSLQLLERKRRAWIFGLAISLLAAVLHCTKGMDWEEAALSGALAAGLWITRGQFQVKSREWHWRGATGRLAAVVALAFVYGSAGFWWLDPREFGVDFAWGDALRETLDALLLMGSTGLTPRTEYARWFLESLNGITFATLAYGAWNCFRPVLHHFRIHPRKAALAARIVQAHGRTAQDYFKCRLDKSFFFSDDRQAFLAYRVGAGLALVLGDPVGEPGHIRPLIAAFREYCRSNDWGLVFHQASPGCLGHYEACGMRHFKLGDEAIVNLDEFTLEGKRAKAFRATLKQFERAGIATRYYPAPVPAEVLDAAEAVSREWLQLPGRRERQFTVGQFERGYVESTGLLGAYTQEGEMLGFLNFIPSYRPGEATLDLMRRKEESPNGTMDFLFLRAFAHAKERGHTRFNLGMAPMGGFQPGEEPSLEERAAHAFFQHLTVVFSFSGLRAYKAKFASAWEPLYVVYGSRLDLARLPLALRRVSEFPKGEGDA